MFVGNKITNNFINDKSMPKNNYSLHSVGISIGEYDILPIEKTTCNFISGFFFNIGISLGEFDICVVNLLALLKEKKRHRRYCKV